MKYSLFIGRWQPLHGGHEALIKKVLEEGKNVCIAIRNTEPGKKNPFSVEQREEMIHESFHEYGDRVKVITIPDIEEVCYGRTPGWNIRKVNLPEELEGISGTETRARLRKQGKL